MVAEARRYKIGECLGRGGFGTVYRAELIGTSGFRKSVALKILNADMNGNEDIVRRLRDEARMLGLVRHPGIVHADALIQLDGRWTLVMEHIPGVGLNEILQQGGIPQRCAVELVGRVADALHAAHAATDGDRPLNLVHRDMKPSNIVLGPVGEVKLLDFGVARAEFETREAQTRSIMFGSADYMAPERWDCQDLPAGDVFSLGEVLYECLSGEPFGRTLPSPEKHASRVTTALDRLSAPDLFESSDTAVILRPMCPSIPDGLRDLLWYMLAYDPAERPSAREVESYCRELAPAMKGPWLRDWAEREVPRVLGLRPPRSDDPLSGAMLVEPSGTMEVMDGKLPSNAGPQVSPKRRTPWIAVIASLAGLPVVATGVFLGVRILSTQDEGAEMGQDVPPAISHPIASPEIQKEIDPSPSTEIVAAPSKPESAPVVTAPAPKPMADPVRKTATAAPVVTPSAPQPTVAPTSGRVVIKGDAQELRLVSANGQFSSGNVPVGSYEIQARFSGRGLLSVGHVQVRAGQTVTVSCNAAFAMCKVNP